MLAITWQEIIATPFGYLIDWLYRLTSHYGVTIMLFALIVQLVMEPIKRFNRKNAEKKRRLQPLIAQIRDEYADDVKKQEEYILELYKKEKVNLAVNYIAGILPFFLLIPIFQVLAQPITYMFHESPETAAQIVAVMREEAPELFGSSYNQVTAIRHISQYADAVREAVPEVSERTLEGLHYQLLGVDLSVVLGTHVLGRGVWAWDWAHIGALALPVVYMGRRIYLLFSGMIRSLIDYSKKKKRAKKLCLTPPKMPKPPLGGLVLLLLSLTGMASVPAAMDLYWLTGNWVSRGLQKLFDGIRDNRIAAKATAEDQTA